MGCEKVLKKNVNLLVRFGRRRMTFTIGHSDSVRIAEQLIDLDAVIERLPSLGLVF